MGPVVLTVLIISSVVFCYKKCCKKVVAEIEEIIGDDVQDDDYEKMDNPTSDENNVVDPDNAAQEVASQQPKGKQQNPEL